MQVSQAGILTWAYARPKPKPLINSINSKDAPNLDANHECANQQQGLLSFLAACRPPQLLKSGSKIWPCPLLLPPSSLPPNPPAPCCPPNPGTSPLSAVGDGSCPSKVETVLQWFLSCWEYAYHSSKILRIKHERPGPSKEQQQ